MSQLHATFKLTTDLEFATVRRFFSPGTSQLTSLFWNYLRPCKLLSSNRDACGGMSLSISFLADPFVVGGLLLRILLPAKAALTSAYAQYPNLGQHIGILYRESE
jgi:hypothetical protein